jgi:hypothetical protein
VAIARIHKCNRQSCLNHGHICYNLPTYGHAKLNSGHLREWSQAIKNDAFINVNHPPPGMVARLVVDKQVEQSKKQAKSASESTSVAIPATAGPGINLNFNLSGGGLSEWFQQQATPLRGRTDSELRERGTTPSAASPLPPRSSPIPAASNKDSRLAAFIRSRISARPSQAREFERALSMLTGAGVGFSDIAQLTVDEWREIGIRVGIRMDLLKNDKIWHLQNAEGRIQRADANCNEIETQAITEYDDSEL